MESELPSTKLRLLLFICCLTFSSCCLGFTPTAAPTSRDILSWPFANYSIWNLPIGSNAVYVAANLNISNNTFIEADPDLLFLYPQGLPIINITYSSALWTGASRCAPTDPVHTLMQVPYNLSFLVASDGNNYGAAFLLQDMQTIVQTQPLAHCTANGSVTSGDVLQNVNLYTDGIRGAHGGSYLSAIGGTIRLGEFIPDGQGVVHSVRHALKSNLWAARNYYRQGNNRTTCYRWPASNCDGYFADGQSDQYGGDNSAVRPGSLLALPTSLNISALTYQTGLLGWHLAWTLQNYGLYLVDDSYWDAIALETETSPSGVYTQQFQQAWGYSFNSRSNAWAKDVIMIFSLLAVVDNWDQTLYNSVSTSDGAQGSGGGTPLQAWAPAFVAATTTTTSTSTTTRASSSTTTTASTSTTLRPTTSTSTTQRSTSTSTVRTRTEQSSSSAHLISILMLCFAFAIPLLL